MNVSEAKAGVAAADERELLDRVLAEIGQVVGPDVSEARRENPARGIMIAAPIALALWGALALAIYNLWLPFLNALHGGR